MPFAEMSALEIIGVATPVVVCLAGAIGLLFKTLISAKDAVAVAKDEKTALLSKVMEERLKEAEGLKKIYAEVAAEAVRSATETQNFYRQKEGKPPIVLPAPVVPEGNSPSTLKQLEVAQAASMRAALVVLKEESGQTPRQYPGEPVDLHGGPTPAPAGSLERAGAAAVVAQDAAHAAKTTLADGSPAKAELERAGATAVIAGKAVAEAAGGPGKT